MSNACGTLWNLSARNAKDQEALWDMGAVSMLKNLIHSKHKMIAMGSAAALRNLMANRPAKYKDANIMSPGSSLPSLHVRKQKALEAELDAQHLSETFDNIDNLSPKTSHRNKQRHKQNLYSEYVLDPNRHEDGVCRSENFNTGNITVLSPYLNTTMLPGSSSSSRGNADGSRSEKDRSLDRERAIGLSSYQSTAENSGNSSKRIGMQISTTATQISKVMEEVSNMHIPQEERSSGSVAEMHCLSEDRNALRRTSAAHSHTNTYNFPKSENRTCPVPYAKVEYKRASNDSLNSVSSSDGYGKRGQMKPIESYSEDDESKFCSYGQYPADLAHKIHSANHMDDNDGELDTPINYSLKYSDEQLNSGRQSPSQNERWARPKHIIEEEMKQNEQRQSRSQSGAYPVYTESGDDKHMSYPTFGQSECVSPFRSRESNSSEQNRVGCNHGINPKASQSLCQVDYEDDKPTNYSERYSEEEQHEEEDHPTNYSIKYNEEEHHVDQPIDYSLKYSTDVPPSAQKPSFSFSKSPSVQSTKTDHISSSSRNTSASAGSKRHHQLHPNSAQNRAAHSQKPASCKAPSINQETIQTYCVEDTPICFSRCSSLSSLSSAEDETGRDQATHVTDTDNSLKRGGMKENSGNLSGAGTTSETSSASQHIRTKSNRLQASGLSPSDSARHKAVEFSSGAKSPSKSGAQTPKSPPEHYLQETPLMFSRCTSVSSLDSFESRSIASSVQSEPCSGMVSGIISPSDLPDSPGQTMPPSRSKTPPPAQTPQVKREASKTKALNSEKRESGPRQTAVNTAVQRVQVLQDADTLLHFATESTPDGFSCSSSLSALSLDEPFIQKDVELRIMPPVHENDHGNDTEPEQPSDTKNNQEKEAEKPTETEKDILDASDDDDIDILEECIISAMPTKSSRKAKKPSQITASKIPPPVARKPSQLPVYKLLPSQSRLNSQKHVSFTPGDDMPRVYCVEGTPINFSTATSLSDLTIESPPNELANTESGTGMESAELEKRDTIPTEGRSTDDAQRGKGSTGTTVGLDDDKAEEGDDILAECINSAMPKGKSHKPFRVKKIMDQIQHASTSPSISTKNQLEADKKKPTSPVKPMPQSNEYRARLRKSTEPKSNFSNERTYMDNKDTKKQNLKNNSRDFNDKLPNNEDRTRGSFAFDSPHHYTPIEGTPYCFSRNDSLSSLDFDDDVDLSREKAELRKGKEGESKSSTNTEQISNQQSSSRTQACQKPIGRNPPKTVMQKQAPFSQSTKDIADRSAATDEKMQNFAIENTPVCFSRNSSLSSLSDIDQENNNKESEPIEQIQQSDAQIESSRPQVSGYAPKSFHVEDTPVCFSRNSSLSSLSIDSEDDLLQECISSAMPKKKKPSRAKGDSEKSSCRSMGGILAEDLTLDLKDIQRPDSEHGFSPDSENFDWKAIQEGANSIVSSLHQAAAAACLSRQASSDSDSILSLKSGISLGSPFHLTPDQEEKPFTSNKGPRIIKPGEKSTLETKKVESENKGVKGGKKVYKSMITGKARSNSELTSHLKQPLQTNMPSISRGRTMIHIPGVRNSSSSTSPVSKKGPQLKSTASKSPNESQSSTSSPRVNKPSVKSEPSPISRQSSQPGASSKGPSRSGSRDSTPSRPQQQPLTRPLQSPGRNSISPGRNGINPPNKLSQLPRTSSPSTASTKSSGSGRMAYTSPGRQMNQQSMSKQTGLPKSSSGIPRSESASKGLNQTSGISGSSKKADLSRMSSAKSSGSESDRSERPVLVRQSTFIKETPSPTLRRKLEESASFESLSPSRPDSPTQSQTQTPVLSPSLPDMSLSTHSTIQTSGWRKLPPNLSPSLEYNDGRPTKRHDIARSHSESPSRLPINRSGTWKREHSKHSSSLPRVSTWRRTGSSSSILSASSESSEKAKSEDEKQHISSFSGLKQAKESQAPTKGTWRKIKENEIPQIMTSPPQNTSSGATNGADSKTLIYQMAPAVSKTEDVWVRIEDCPINNPRSGKSPTGNTPPIIDSVSEKGNVNSKDSKDLHGKQNAGNGNVPVRTIGLEPRLNSFAQVDSPDKKGTEAKPVLSNTVPAPEASESTVNERTPFSSSSSSKHSSPSGAVAARVTPFNYNPSPRKSSADGSSTRPSQIPTPVNSTKKRDSKTESTDSSGAQSPKRHSGSYLVTSV